MHDSPAKSGSLGTPRSARTHGLNVLLPSLTTPLRTDTGAIYRHAMLRLRLPRRAPHLGTPDCPVCFEGFTDLFPTCTSDPHSRAPSGRWACQHSVCRDCDRACQNGHNNKCPLCRAVRRVIMLP